MAVGFGLLVLVIFVIVKNSGGDDSSSKLTVCESAWREAERSASEAGPDNDTRVMAQSTLTACDTVAEWDAANVKFGSKIGEGAVAADKLCSDLGVKSTPLCLEAKQTAAPPGT